MAEARTVFGGFLARPNDDRVKVLGMAFIVAFGSAALVSTTSIALKPLQEANFSAERAARMEAMLDTLPGLRKLMEETGVTALETRLVVLETGQFDADADPAGFDFAAAFADEALSRQLPTEIDLASLGRSPIFAPVHLLERDGALELIVLPMVTQGYAARIHAMLALEPDLRTVAALTITEQSETPGLGARIEEPTWQAKWPGKQVADAGGQIILDVVRGQATAPYEVDGITGATRTSNAIGNMIHFWLGPYGYGPFLERLAREGALR